jgi:hypothetical protein
MGIDRRQLLVQHQQASQIANDQGFPQDLGNKAKRAADLASGMQDAAARKMGLPGSGLRQPDDPMNRPLPPTCGLFDRDWPTASLPGWVILFMADRTTAPDMPEWWQRRKDALGRSSKSGAAELAMGYSASLGRPIAITL